MKKLILLFVACVSLTSIISCSNDDDNSSASLLGKWEYSKEGFGANGIEELTDYEHTPGCNKDYVEITANQVSDYSYFDSGTGCTEDVYITPYTRNGNSITVGTGADTSTGTIVSLTNTTLKVKYSDPDFPGIDLIYVHTRVN